MSITAQIFHLKGTKLWERTRNHSTNSRKSSDRGRTNSFRVEPRAFGDVFSAMSKKTNSIVAIKKLKKDFLSHDVEKEGDLLKECRSDFIVSVSDCYITESEVWVSLFGSV